MDEIEKLDVVGMEYDIVHAFKRIEEKLIEDIMENLEHSPHTHKDKGLTAHWKIEQLKRLELFRMRNNKEYSKEFEDLNTKVEEIIRSQFYQGLSQEHKNILKALQNGYTPVTQHSVDVKQVFALNERKLNSLIKATTDDLKKAEYAVLRRAEDEYRKIIFDAEVALNTGSYTYTEAIDRASKDFLAKGIQCVRYKNGAIHTIADYADMAVKTADMKAYMVGEGEMRKEHSCHLVIVNRRGDNPCKCCIPYIGKILVDDVYSGGTAEEAKRLGYPLLSEAIKNGLYHPRCKDMHTTYFPGLTRLPKPLTKEQIAELEEKDKKRQKESYKKRMVKKYEQMAELAPDEDAKIKYKAKANEWKNKKM